jgi:hypothetical protein
MRYAVSLIPVLIGLGGFLGAQVPNPTQQKNEATTQPGEPVPIYRVNVVGRTTTAVNYNHSGLTKIDLKGTVLLPEVKGEAKVERRKGATQIDAKCERLEAPTRFGSQYLTYVLWAITPNGRASNLGQILTDEDNKGELRTSTELQVFALVVTAEPYFMVTQPSDVVVAENTVRKNTAAQIETVKANYALLNRGEYTYNVKPTGSEASGATQKKLPIDRYNALLAVYEAQNAVQIAGSIGADRYAPEVFQKAERLLGEARNYYAQRAKPGLIVTTARQATQAAEDARIIAVRSRSEKRSEPSRRANGESPEQSGDALQ